MDTVRRSPLVPAAAIAVLILSAVGVAAFTGLIPSASSKVQASAEAAKPVVAEAPKAAAKTCPTCGVIASIKTAEVKAQTSGVGAVAGGVAGAVVGNQFGHGDGRAVMTIAGAAGGAFAGNEIEKHVKKHTVYRVTVRLDDGRLVTVSKNAAPAFAVGERVRLNGNALERG